MADRLEVLLEKVRAFQAESAEILGQCEANPAKVVSVEASLALLSALTLEQDELLRQALFCVANGFYPVAIVSSWAALIDAVENVLFSDRFAKLHARYPNWAGYKTLEDLRENISEYGILDAAKELGVFGKGETRMLHGMLAKRNKCAHPSNYKPKFNDTLGYVTEAISWIEAVSQKIL